MGIFPQATGAEIAENGLASRLPIDSMDVSVASLLPDQLEKALSKTDPGLMNLGDYARLLSMRSFESWRRVVMSALLVRGKTLRRVPGHTVMAVDVSGSMRSHARHHHVSRRTLATVIAVLAREVCDELTLYVTGGDDDLRLHQTKKLPAELRGFELSCQLEEGRHVRGGGIFVRQVLEYLHKEHGETPERIVLVGDEQDIGRGLQTYAPPGRNYYIDVSAAASPQKGIWTTQVEPTEAELFAMLLGPTEPLFALEKNGRPLTAAVEF